jgi:hypothetical protein
VLECVRGITPLGEQTVDKREETERVGRPQLGCAADVSLNSISGTHGLSDNPLGEHLTTCAGYLITSRAHHAKPLRVVVRVLADMVGLLEDEFENHIFCCIAADVEAEGVDAFGVERQRCEDAGVGVRCQDHCGRVRSRSREQVHVQDVESRVVFGDLSVKMVRHHYPSRQAATQRPTCLADVKAARAHDTTGLSSPYLVSVERK